VSTGGTDEAPRPRGERLAELLQEIDFAAFVGHCSAQSATGCSELLARNPESTEGGIG
jgi:hypothetical protein